MKELTPAQKIERAKIQLTILQPFWASLALRMELEPKPDAWFEAHGNAPTMCTDGKMIYYSETFVEQTPLRQLEGTIAEEVGHVAFMHTTRRDWRDPHLYNLACDGVIHPILKEAQFELPETAFFDDECKDKSVEQAYAILEKRWPPQKQPQGGGGNGKGKGGGKQPPGGKGNQPPDPGCGQGMDHGGSSAERSTHEQEWTVALEQAAQMAKAAGNLPASLERLVNEIKKPAIDWRSVLREFFEKTNPADYAWFPSAKRYVASGIYLPSVVKEGYGIIAIGVDTSGSISQEQLVQFMSEVNDIITEIKPTETHVIYCDTQVSRVDVFREGEPLIISATGGGGTDFAPVFRYVEKQRLEPKCLIYLTDLQGPCEIEEPPYATLWCTQDPQLEGKFGQTLRMPPE